MTGTAVANLIDKGGGLIYDSEKNITWLQDANYAKTSGYDSDGLMTWAQAVAWADQLEYGGSSDWRLPTTLDGEFEYGYSGSTALGYNIITSEMGNMYYVNLENLAPYTTSGGSQLGCGLNNVDSFVNINHQKNDYYWSGTSSPSDYSLYAYVFSFYDGEQSTNLKANGDFTYAWAVCDGDVSAVPIPGAVWLLGSGLIGIVGIRRKLKN